MRPLSNLRKYGNRNRCDQHDAQCDPQLRYPTLKPAFALGMKLELLQECDAAGDAPMAPRSTIGVETITPRHIRQGFGENANAHRTERWLFGPYRRFGKLVVQVGVWRTI